jgi:hypothetical protein
MSVMFEVLEHLEKKDADAAIGLASRAWSAMMEPSLVPAPQPIPAAAAEVASQDLNNLSRVAARGKRKSSLLDIRFDQETAPARKPRRASSKSAPEESTDFPSLWAMARLCKKRSRL